MRDGVDHLEHKIDKFQVNNTDESWTLFDKFMYGGLGYGAFCLPSNVFKIIFTVIFPPLGEILSIIGDFVISEFPYITWKTLKQLFKNLDRIIYSFILTSMFYIPGLIYTLGNITCQYNEGS